MLFFFIEKKILQCEVAMHATMGMPCRSQYSSVRRDHRLKSGPVFRSHHVPVAGEGSINQPNRAISVNGFQVLGRLFISAAHNARNWGGIALHGR